MKPPKTKAASVDDFQSNHEIMESRLGGDFAMSPFDSGADLLASMEKEHFDVFLIDVHMPEDGFLVAKNVVGHAQYKGQPILFVSYDQSFPVITRCLQEVGADYVSRTVTPEELRARIHSLIAIHQQKTLRLGQLSLDPLKVSATILSGPLDLTMTEFKILTFLLTRKDHCIHRDYLQKQVWGDILISEKTLNSHLSNLRLKLIDGGILLQVDRKGLVEILVKR